ncbi:hypothetical protein BH10ACT7_BH10ACT7_19080 [soil metagenome]
MGTPRLSLTSTATLEEMGKTMAGKFVISKDKKGEFRFVLKAGNGEIIAISEGYAAKASALNGIESVRKNAADATVVDES